MFTVYIENHKHYACCGPINLVIMIYECPITW